MTESECLLRIEFAEEGSPVSDLFALAKKIGISGPDLHALIEERLEVGRVKFGPLEVTRPRDWLQEAAEEIADASVYLTLKEDEVRNRPGRL